MLRNPSRRTFVKGLGAASTLAGLGLWRPLVQAAEGRDLAGQHFELFIGQTPVNITGRPRTALTVNNSLPGPLLRWREGDTVTLRVRNRLAQDTSIHWHGIILPANMDGVPGLSFAGIEPGGDYLYQFTLRQSGTYWYHSHSGLQEQAGVYGAIVIEPREPETHRYQRDHVLLFSDWSDQAPEHLMATLKTQSDAYNFHKRTVGDFIDDVAENGWSATVAERTAWARMRMSPTDLRYQRRHLHLPAQRPTTTRQLHLPVPARRNRAPAADQCLSHDLLRLPHPRAEADGDRRRRLAGNPCERG